MLKKLKLPIAIILAGVLWMFFYDNLLPLAIVDSMGREGAGRLAEGIALALVMLGTYLMLRRIGNPLTGIGVSLQQVYDAFDYRYEFAYEVMKVEGVGEMLHFAAITEEIELSLIGPQENVFQAAISARQMKAKALKSEQDDAIRTFARTVVPAAVDWIMSSVTTLMAEQKERSRQKVSGDHLVETQYQVIEGAPFVSVRVTRAAKFGGPRN